MHQRADAAVITSQYPISIDMSAPLIDNITDHIVDMSAAITDQNIPSPLTEARQTQSDLMRTRGERK